MGIRLLTGNQSQTKGEIMKNEYKGKMSEITIKCIRTDKDHLYFELNGAYVNLKSKTMLLGNSIKWDSMFKSVVNNLELK